MELFRSLAAQHPHRGASSSASFGINLIVHNHEHVIVFVGDDGTHFYTHDGGKSYRVIWHADKLGESSC